MKKLYSIAVFLLASCISNAQSTNYKAFKVNLGIGYAIPSTTTSGGTSGGAAFSLEPQYRINNKINVGLRIEGAAVGSVNTGSGNADVSVLSSYTASGEYYFKPSGFRPFAGVGAGIYRLANASVSASSGSSSPTINQSGSKFGFYPRVGFETGHFRVTSEYNVVTDGGYLSFKLGFFFGGGKK
ncbi:MAG TPA: hypothetical protein DCL43_11820 [Chitinophagaceae bacterium]|nr:hypothetical protein [Chitinophagaceae bacterium]HAN39010.1 hypothetical protein [Chitinophagaceae bacterium]